VGGGGWRLSIHTVGRQSVRGRVVVQGLVGQVARVRVG